MALLALRERGAIVALWATAARRNLWTKVPVGAKTRRVVCLSW